MKECREDHFQQINLTILLSASGLREEKFFNSQMHKGVMYNQTKKNNKNTYSYEK